jgi:hypothetical protein
LFAQTLDFGFYEIIRAAVDHSGNREIDGAQQHGRTNGENERIEVAIRKGDVSSTPRNL